MRTGTHKPGIDQVTPKGDDRGCAVYAHLYHTRELQSTIEEADGVQQLEPVDFEV